MNNILSSGLKPLPRDDRDLKLGAIVKLPKLEDLPKDYFINPLSIKDQITDGNDDYCGAAAGSGMVEPKEEAELYYPYLFAAAKFESNDSPDDWGLSLRDVGKALVKWGIPEVKDIPQEIKDMTPSQRRIFANYPESVRLAATKHKYKSYAFISGPYDSYGNACATQWLYKDQKKPILFGLSWHWSLSDYVLNGISDDGFGHALWQNGFFYNENKKGVYAVNAAGVVAGKNGIHEIPRDVFNYYADKYGLLTVTDYTPDEIREVIKRGIMIEQRNILLRILNVLLNFIKTSRGLGALKEFISHTFQRPY